MYAERRPRFFLRKRMNFDNSCLWQHEAGHIDTERLLLCLSGGRRTHRHARHYNIINIVKILPNWVVECPDLFVVPYNINRAADGNDLPHIVCYFLISFSPAIYGGRQP